MKNWLSKIALLSIILTGASTASAASGKIDITVSVPPQAYFVEKIGGNYVATHIMIPSGANPATYEPTPKQLISLSNSKIYVKVGVPGFGFEKKFLMTFLDRNPGMTVIDTSEGVRLRKGDPHIWTSPAPVRVAAVNIARALALHDPPHKNEYEKNLKGFLVEIDKLDESVKNSLKGKAGYSFMIYHPAWGYFADEYNLVQVPIEDHGKPGNAAHIRAMIDIAHRKGIRDIFVQKGLDAKNAETIAAELGGKVVEADPLDRNWPRGLMDFAHKVADAARK